MIKDQYLSTTLKLDRGFRLVIVTEDEMNQS